MHCTIETDIVKCQCGGTVALVGRKLFSYEGVPVVTEASILGNYISGCPSGCTKVASSSGSTSVVGKIQGEYICLQEKISSAKTNLGIPLKYETIKAVRTNFTR